MTAGEIIAVSILETSYQVVKHTHSASAICFGHRLDNNTVMITYLVAMTGIVLIQHQPFNNQFS